MLLSLWPLLDQDAPAPPTPPTHVSTPLLPALPKPLPLRGQGLLVYRVTAIGTARLVHASARLEHTTHTTVRTPHWQHLSLPLELLDLLTDDWDA